MILDASLIESTFGWGAEVPFAESVRRTLRWYDQYGVGAVFSHLALPPDKN